MATSLDPGKQTTGDFKIEGTLAQPLTAGMTPLPIYDSAGIKGKPVFTVESFIDHNPDTGETKTYHPGSGDGLLVIHPSELEDYHLYGTGVTPGSEWPSDLSEVTLLLHNGGVAGATGVSISRVAFGLPLRTTVKPASGAYFELTSVGDLCLNFTDSEGADAPADKILKTNGAMRADNGFIYNVVPVTSDVDALFGQAIYMTGGASKTVSMPNIAALDVGKIIFVINRSGFSWTVDGDGADTIDGSATGTITDGSTWQLMAVTTTKWVTV